MELNSIEFEGKIVKPNKNGLYYCPYCKSTTGYSRPKWKTEKGFKGHMAKCMSKPSVVDQIKNKQNENQVEFDKMKIEVLSNLEYKIGDKIVYIREIIIKPTHEQRFNRMVRVRYEAVKRWEAYEGVISNIEAIQYNNNNNNNILPPSLEYLKNNNVIISVGYHSMRISGIFNGTLKEAEEKAKEETKLYKEACDFASMCR